MIAKNSTVESDELIFITMTVEKILYVKTVSLLLSIYHTTFHI